MASMKFFVRRILFKRVLAYLPSFSLSTTELVKNERTTANPLNFISYNKKIWKTATRLLLRSLCTLAVKC